LHEIERVLRPGGVALITGNFSDEDMKELKSHLKNFKFIQPEREMGSDKIRVLIAEKK